MLHHEFNQLIGREATYAEYNKANGIYMTTDIDKQTFCQEWEAGLKDSKTLAEMYDRFNRVSDKKGDYAHAMKTAADALLYAIEIEKASGELEDIVTTLVDRKYITSQRLRRGFKLSQNDIDFILENI